MGAGADGLRRAEAAGHGEADRQDVVRGGERVPALVVEIQDAVGGLHPILKVLSDAAVNVQHLYAFVSRVESKSLCVLTVPDVGRAEALLRAAGHTVLGPGAVTGQPARAKDEALGAHLGLDFIW